MTPCQVNDTKPLTEVSGRGHRVGGKALPGHKRIASRGVGSEVRVVTAVGLPSRKSD